MGIGQDAAFIGYNNWIGGNSYGGSYVAAAYPKSALLAGGTVTWYSSGVLPNNGSTPHPAHRHGYTTSPPTWPPAGSPHYIVAYDGNTGAGNVYTWGYPTNTGAFSHVGPLGSTYTAAPVPGYTNYCAAATTSVDNLSPFIMKADLRYPNLYYVRTNGNGSDLTCHSSNIAGQACNVLNWGMYNVSTRTSVGSWNLAAQGNHLFMPDIAADKNGDVVAGYTYVKDTGASGPTFLSAYISGHQQSDAAGVMGAPLSAHDGTTKVAMYVTTDNHYRWGDYMSVVVDPSDGCTFWFNGMYSGTTAASYTDHTWISNWRYSTCAADTKITALNTATAYACHQTVAGTISDSTGTPTNAVYHSTTGGAYPAAISGSGGNYTVAAVTTDQLGAADGDTIWLTCTYGDLTAGAAPVVPFKCGMNVCLSSVDPFTGGCDGDIYMDQNETLNVYPRLKNSESFATPTDFTADLVVDPAYPNANVTIVHGTRSYAVLAAGATQGPETPFQVRYTAAGGGPVLVHFKIRNIRADDGSWTSSSACANTFTEYANANDQVITTLVSEGFDGTTFPPTGWVSTANVAGTASWARATAMANPTMTPHSGAGMAYFNSYNIASGSQARLATPTFSLAGRTMPKVNFYMTHDSTWSNDDNIQVQISVNGGTTYTTLQTFHRPDGGTASGVWRQHSVDLSAYVGQTSCRVGFLGVSAYGDNMSIDQVVVGDYQRVNDTNVCSGAAILSYSDGDWQFNDDRCNNTTDWDNWVPSMDAGESGDLIVYLANNGSEMAYNVQGTLTCPSCPAEVTICKSTADYGDIPYGTGLVYSPGGNGFEVALGTSLTAGADLPFVVTLTATGYTPPTVATVTSPHSSANTRVGTITLGGSCASPYGPAFGGTTDVFYDNFLIAPSTAGTSGRCGPDWSTVGWTVGSGTVGSSTISTAPTGDAYAARMTVTTGGVNFWRKFSTVGYDADVKVHAYIDQVAATTCLLYLEYTPNTTGTPTWYVISGPYAGTGTASWGSLGPLSIYWSIYNLTGTGYGPAAANAILNNPNFGIRFRATRTGGTSATYFYIDDVEVDMYKYVNRTTGCTGACLPPDAPEILAVEDADPCAQSGITVYYNGSYGAAGYDLLKDGASVVTGYTSGATYDPGDLSSHTYTIRANSTSGSTNSAAVVFADGVQPGIAITSITDNNPGLQNGIYIYYTSTGLGNDLYKDGTLVVTGYISGALYNPGDTNSHTYTVRGSLGSCTKTSAGYAFADAAGTPPPGTVLPGGGGGALGKSGADILFTWSAAKVTCNPSTYEIYRGALGSYYSHSILTCDTSGLTNWTNVSGLSDSNNYYYLIVPATASKEGSYGMKTGGIEIPQASTPCLPQDLTACTP